MTTTMLGSFNNESGIGVEERCLKFNMHWEGYSLTSKFNAKLVQYKDELIPTAYNDNDMVMAFRHCRYRLYGVQFHPESVLTENGLLMLKNWLEIQ